MVLSTRIRVASIVLSLCTLSARAQTTPTTPTEAPAATAPPAPAAATTPTVIAAAPLTSATLLPPTSVPGNYTSYLVIRYVADKEARAAIHMFGRKRTGGTFWILGGGALVGYLALQAGTKTTSTGTYTVTVSPLAYLIYGGVPTGIGICKLTRFSNVELYKMLLEYDKAHALPGYVIGKLNKSDYQ